MFMYLLLLEDPEPVPLIGIEEPENGLYHKLLEELTRELLRHGEEGQDRTQLFITTHSPYFVDALRPEQVWLMEKDQEGRTQIRRTADIEVVKPMIDEGIPLGSLWYSNHFEENFIESIPSRRSPDVRSRCRPPQVEPPDRRGRLLPEKEWHCSTSSSRAEN
jgi:hypothetical protein